MASQRTKSRQQRPSRQVRSAPSSACLRVSVVDLLLAVAVGLVAVAVFARLIGCGFTDWDDRGTIWGNPRLNPPSLAAVGFYWTTLGQNTPGQLYTPVTYTAWSALAAVAGRPVDAFGLRLQPAAFHAANVVLHATTAGLVYLLLARLSARRWPAAAGALLFALHPVQVEPVAWASGTKDVLCGLFSVAALLAYVAAVRATGRGPRRWRYAVATASFGLAMLSKPTALMVPPMAAAVDVLLLGRPVRTVARWLWPWAVLMIPCVLWTRAAQPAAWASPVALWQRPLVAGDAVAFYLCKVAWPAHLGVDYGRRPGLVVASGLAYWTWLLPAAVAAALAWGRNRTLAAAAGLFVLPLVPVLGLVPFEFEFYSTVADHYLYLPMLGVALAATWGLARLPARPTAVAAGLGLAALAARSVAAEPAWQDTQSLFANALVVNPRSFVACDMLGGVEAYYRAGALRGPGAILPSTDPDYPRWRAHLEAALGWYAQSLQRYDGYVPSLINVATYAGRLGRHDQQRAALRRVVQLQPTLPPAMRADPAELANRLIAAGDPATAVAYLDGQVAAHPGDRQLFLLRARAAAAKADPPATRPVPP